MVPEYYIKSSVESHIQWATNHSALAESIMVGLAEHALPAKSLFCIKKCYKKVLDSQVSLIIVNPTICDSQPHVRNSVFLTNLQNGSGTVSTTKLQKVL